MFEQTPNIDSRSNSIPHSETSKVSPTSHPTCTGTQMGLCIATNETEREAFVLEYYA